MDCSSTWSPNHATLHFAPAYVLLKLPEKAIDVSSALTFARKADSASQVYLRGALLVCYIKPCFLHIT